MHTSGCVCDHEISDLTDGLIPWWFNNMMVSKYGILGDGEKKEVNF
jgi:hypothetical protein